MDKSCKENYINILGVDEQCESQTDSGLNLVLWVEMYSYGIITVSLASPLG